MLGLVAGLRLTVVVTGLVANGTIGLGTCAIVFFSASLAIEGALALVNGRVGVALVALARLMDRPVAQECLDSQELRCDALGLESRKPDRSGMVSAGVGAGCRRLPDKAQAAS
jgi:hypothetical protein